MMKGTRDEVVFFFFFQAEDGIRDLTVTGVQTCALPISGRTGRGGLPRRGDARARPRRKLSGSNRARGDQPRARAPPDRGLGEEIRSEIGRASCRERV